MATEVFPNSEDEMTPEQLQRFYAAKAQALLSGDKEAYDALVNRSILGKKTAEPVVKQPAKAKTEEVKADVKSN
jgi:hypothetical protein